MGNNTRITPNWIDTLKENEIFICYCRNSGWHFYVASCFALEVIRASYDSHFMIDLYVYVKHTSYTCSFVIGACKTQDDVFEGLSNPEQLQKYLDKIDELIDTIDRCFVE